MADRNDIFWLNARNMDFPRTRVIHSQALKDTNRRVNLLFIVAIGSAGFIYFKPQWAMVLSTLAAALMLMAAGLRWLAQRRKQGLANLARNGTVLQGEIVESQVKSVNGGRRSYVEVRYRLQTPHGNTLIGKNWDYDPDRLKYGQPSPGQPVRVVYWDDSTFRML